MSGFPTTRRSVLLAARSEDDGERRRAYGAIVAVYWKPAYAYVRWHWKRPPEDARDLVQGFFAAAYEKGFLERYDPVRARFRTWLRVCLDGHVSNHRQAESRAKRGGGEPTLSLDFEGAEAGLADRSASGLDPEALFEREWVRSLFEDAIAALRARCEAEDKTAHLRVFMRYDIEDHPQGQAPSYADLARELDLPVTQITNHLHWTRRVFRGLVLDRLRELTVDEAEFRSEARRLLGRETP